MSASEAPPHTAHAPLDTDPTRVVPQAITFTLNGAEVATAQPPFRRLLDVLRVDFGMTGTKEGCGEGECGACTILLDGEPVNACLIPVCQAEGASIVTVEGLAEHDVLHPVQQAFIDHGGAQCGICTPGMVVTAAWLVDKKLPADQIDRVLAGNICRCTGYAAIIASVQAAIAATQGEQP